MAERPWPTLCVVVGATGAFGRAVTERLVDARPAGARRSAGTRRDLAALAAEVPGVTPCVADIADDAAIEAIGAALDGPVRMAVFAAGLPIAGSVETVAPGDLARGADIKLGGLLRLVRAVDARLVPGSRIVMFAGSLGFEPKPSSAGPGAINAGVFNLMRQLGDVYGPRGDHHPHAQPRTGGHAAAARAGRARRRRDAASASRSSGRRTPPAPRWAGSRPPTRSPGR